MTLDKVVSTVVGLGVPGLILVGAMATSGFAGAAALTVALSTLGGPLGMLGGVAVLGVLLLISKAITEFGTEKIYAAVIQGLFDKGMTKTEIRVELRKYPIGADLRSVLEDQIKATKTKRRPK
jgi:hypothetical protein